MAHHEGLRLLWQVARASYTTRGLLLMLSTAPFSRLVLTILATLTILVLAVGAVACGGDAATPTPAGPPPTPTPLPTPIAAQTLYQEYERNEVSAKAKYTDKIVVISGKVAKISEVGSGYDVKLLGTARSALGMQSGILSEVIVCKVAEENISMVIPLNPGDEVTIVGKPQRIGFTDIEVMECRVVN